MSQHPSFSGRLRWTGPDRDYEIDFDGKPVIPGSAPAVYKGNDALHNPESLMISSLMACHALTYMGQCKRAGIAWASYEDDATGSLGVRDGKIRMVEVVLRPRVTLRDPAQVAQALALHDTAHEACFMANSVDFPVRVEPQVSAA